LREQLKDTLWDQEGPFSQSGPLRRHRVIRFLHLDPKRIEQPSHVWYDGIAQALERSIFVRPPDQVIAMRSQVEYNFGDFVTYYDPRIPVECDLDDLLKLEAQYRAEAKEAQ
jgi:hypothetical protein